MESRKKEARAVENSGLAMKTNVLHDRANVHSPRAFLSELTLDYHEIQAFSWRLLREYLFQLLTCRLSNSYDVNMVKNCLDSWMTKRTNLPIVSVASSPLKAWTAKAKMQLWWSRVIYSWSWLVLRSDKDSLWNHHLTSFTRFFRRDTATFWAFES